MPLGSSARARASGAGGATVRLAALALALALGAPSARAVLKPYSKLDPRALNVTVVTRAREQAPDAERWIAGEGAMDATGSFARPTNAWWTMTVLGKGPTEMENANGFQIPYVVWAAKRGMSACMPFVLAQANQVENGFDSNIMFVTLGAWDVAVGHRVVSHDPLSVTLQWDKRGEDPADTPKVPGAELGDPAPGAGNAENAGRASFARMPLVRGSPYLTMEYHNAVPFFDTPQQLDPQVRRAPRRVWFSAGLGPQQLRVLGLDLALLLSLPPRAHAAPPRPLRASFPASSPAPQIGLRVDGELKTCPGTFSGKVFELVLVQSDETWTIWLSHNLTMQCQNGGATLKATAPLTGVVRAAVTNNCTLGRSAFQCAKMPPADPEFATHAAALHEHVGTYPVAAHVDMTATEDDSVRPRGCAHGAPRSAPPARAARGASAVRRSRAHPR